MKNIPEFIIEILKKRNIKEEEFENFLYPSINYLSPLEIIPNIEHATKKIIEFIEKKEKIFIYGDGDIDGIFGSFFWIKFMKEKKVNFEYYLTHRLEDYEIEENFADYLLKENFKLLILIDCGVSSYKFLKKCAYNKIQVILIDHHLFEPENIVEKHIYIHPLFCENRNIEFSATSLSFKLFQNLISKYSPYPLTLNDCISLVGLATLGENVNLVGDNRIYVKEMMKNLSFLKIKGLNYLISNQLVDEKIEDTKEILKKINPKVNTPGRFGKPEISLNLLLEENEKEIEKIIKEIEILDRERYKITKKIMKKIENMEKRFIILEDFPISLCGIIASKLVEKFNLPFLVMSKKGNIIFGSGRAPYYFNLYENMKKIKNEFISFGGHRGAIGFKFNQEKIDKIMEFWDGIKIEKNDEIYFDTVLEIEKINPEIYKWIELLKPFGKGNLPPVFLSKNVLLKKIRKGGIDKFWAKKGNTVFECNILSKEQPDEGIKDIFYTPKIERKDGYYKITLKIKNFKNSLQEQI